ncbi:helix-turn-helix domain-containing protein [Arundinibacter roseus]|uniref:AraC family transcriptional regulator n=1 Tax=Arundinibacter roseus TaxID=2070510 RepID=A0A4R4K2C8_9BACT|nr:helix-turn-helix transcriptional regulator [Arundinibacter roseus]TDB61353.1 AraC family transcriptional regulator [Arundinibacter roseus]
MPQTLTPYKTTQLCIELEEDVRIYVSKNTRMMFPSLETNDMVILVETYPLTRPTLIKYQFIADVSLINNSIGTTAYTGIQIVISNRWDNYFLINHELSRGEQAERVYESHSATLAQRINEFLSCTSDYSNHKLPLFSAFYGLLAALCDETQKSKKSPLNDREKLQMIEKIMVDKFSSRPPSLESMARTVGMSVSKMKLLFKNYYGQSIYQFRQKAKLQYAADLLKTQRYTVSQVAYKVGYHSSIKFIKIFEKHLGVTPGEFKKQAINVDDNSIPE